MKPDQESLKGNACDYIGREVSVQGTFVYPVVAGVGPEAETVTNEVGAKQSHVPYRMDLLPPQATLDVAQVLAAGAAKYGADNWHGIPTRDHLNHLLTHVFAWLAGDRSDEHLSHAACRALMALEKEHMELRAYEREMDRFDRNQRLARDMRALEKELNLDTSTFARANEACGYPAGDPHQLDAAIRKQLARNAPAADEKREAA